MAVGIPDGRYLRVGMGREVSRTVVRRALCILLEYCLVLHKFVVY